MNITNRLYQVLKAGELSFEGAHDIHTPRELVEEILSQVDLNGDILVLFNLEFVISLVYTYQVDPSRITFYSDHETKNKICDQLRVKYIDNLEVDMKFDVVLTNPPYDKGIKTNIKLPFKNIGPHSAFFFTSHSLLLENGTYAVVLPSNFMCLPSAKNFRDWVLSNFEIKRIDIVNNNNQSVFAINMSDIILIQAVKKSKPDNTKISWNGKFFVDLTKYDIWPLFKSETSVSIFDKVLLSKKREIPFHGEKNQKNIPEFIVSNNLTRVGQRENPEPRKMFLKGELKNIKHPVWYGFSNENERDLQWEWFGTEHYAYVLSLVQSSPKNQPFFFRYIGEHDFVNDNFFDHFNITSEEEQEISKWIETFKK